MNQPFRDFLGAAVFIAIITVGAIPMTKKPEDQDALAIFVAMFIVGILVGSAINGSLFGAIRYFQSYEPD